MITFFSIFLPLIYFWRSNYNICLFIFFVSLYSCFIFFVSLYSRFNCSFSKMQKEVGTTFVDHFNLTGTKIVFTVPT